jgi:hypothetical protein
MNDLGEKMQVVGRGWIMARSVTKARPLRKYKLHPFIHTEPEFNLAQNVEKKKWSRSSAGFWAMNN